MGIFAAADILNKEVTDDYTYLTSDVCVGDNIVRIENIKIKPNAKDKTGAPTFIAELEVLETTGTVSVGATVSFGKKVQGEYNFRDIMSFCAAAKKCPKSDVGEAVLDEFITNGAGLVLGARIVPREKGDKTFYNASFYAVNDADHRPLEAYELTPL